MPRPIRRVPASFCQPRQAIAAAAALAAALAAPTAAQVVSVVDHNAGSLGLSFQDLAMSPTGLLAFDASTETTSQRGVFTFDPATGTLANLALAVTNSTNNTVIRDVSQVYVNAAGTVAFQVTFGGSTASARPQGVYTASGVGSVLVLKSGASTSVNAPVPLNNAISLYGIDDGGRSYVSARSSAAPDRRYVLAGDGGATAAALLDNVTPYAGVQGGGFFSFTGGVANGAGTAVAFGAVHLPGPTAGDSGAYLLNTVTNQIITLQDEDADPLFTFVAAPTAILDDGDVLYQNTAGGNQLRRFRRYDLATGQVSDVLDNDGDFLSFNDVQVNAAGQMAFTAILDPAASASPLGVTGVYAGLDPIADEVAVAGAPLLGGTVISAGSPQQAPNGDVYFAYSIDTDNNGFADAGGIARSARPTINAWAGSGGGDFLSPANWSEGVAPNGAGVRAKLGGASAGGGAITLDSMVTLDALSIENAAGYTVAGGGSFTFDGPRYHILGVLAGQHTVSVPVTVAKSGGAINVDGAATSLTIDAPLTFSDPAAYLRKNGTGTLGVRNVRAGGLDLGRGVLRILPNGSADGLSVVNELLLNSVGFDGPATLYAGSLDLTNNALLVDYAAGESPLASIADAIASGHAGGSWLGTGLTSSTAATTPGTAVGFAEASAVGATTFFGRAVDADAVLVRYTRSGDANLDGTTDIADFSILAGNFNAAESTWATGDFNFDGATDIADFSLLAANFNLAAPAARPGAVPEPAAVGFILVAAAAFARRGRRGRRAR